jgi:hypothetical protein
MRIRLDLIETRLQMLIEHWMVPIARNDFQSRLARQLVQALQEHLASPSDDPSGSAQHYTIYMHPNMLDVLHQHTKLLAELAVGMQTAAREAGLLMALAPVIDLVPDDRLTLDGFFVQAVPAPGKTGSTAILHLEPESTQQEVTLKKAFLIVNGQNLFYLSQPVINMGRRMDNHLVIEDERVSRTHAQLRFSRGQFVLFDLNSTGGTTVNGQPVRQWPLKPGDVIALAGYPMIYGEEPGSESGKDDTGQTSVMRSPSE